MKGAHVRLKVARTCDWLISGVCSQMRAYRCPEAICDKKIASRLVYGLHISASVQSLYCTISGTRLCRTRCCTRSVTALSESVHGGQTCSWSNRTLLTFVSAALKAGLGTIGLRRSAPRPRAGRPSGLAWKPHRLSAVCRSRQRTGIYPYRLIEQQGEAHAASNVKIPIASPI